MGCPPHMRGSTLWLVTLGIGGALSGDRVCVCPTFHALQSCRGRGDEVCIQRHCTEIPGHLKATPDRFMNDFGSVCKVLSSLMTSLGMVDLTILECDPTATHGSFSCTKNNLPKTVDTQKQNQHWESS